MKTTLLATAILSCATALNAAPSATLALKDGSTLRAELKTELLDCSSLFAKELPLDPSIVKSIAFTGTNGEAKVELVNGDRLTVTIANQNLAFTSILGDLNVPRANVRSMSLSAKPAQPGDGLIFHCTFDDEAAIASPVVGPAVKLELGEISPDKGKNAGALFVKPGIAGAQIKFPEGAFGPEGCIEFWANMASGKTEFTTGGDPRFFILSNSNWTPRGILEFASNDGAGNSGICGSFFNIHTYSNIGLAHLMPYSDVFKGEDYNGWHHYAFVWTPTSLAILIDGKEVCRRSGQLNEAEISHTSFIMDIPLNRITGKSFNNKSAFYMDDLKIWKIAKREFDLQ